MSDNDFNRRVGAVRRFNRFWIRQIGVLREGYLESSFSLTEVRVLYELAHREETTASELGEELGLDAGYLSRILRGFEKHGLIHKRPSEADGRRPLAQRDRRDAWWHVHSRARTPGQSDASYREAPQRSARPGGPLPTQASPARRHGLGRPPPRRPLCPRVRLG